LFKFDFDWKIQAKGTKMVQRLKEKFGGVLLILLLIAIGYVCFHFLFMDFVIDSWWFDSLGYGKYFWQRAIYRYVIFSGATVIFFAVFFLNFWITSRVLTKPQAKPESGALEQRRIKQIVEKFRYGSLRVYTPLAMILAIILAYPMF
jgi:uncharacterized membrane protein (UPF0182 family)